VGGTSRKHSVPYDSLWRHWRDHVTAEQKALLRFNDVPREQLVGRVAAEEIRVIDDLNFARNATLEALRATPPTDPEMRDRLVGRYHENIRIRGQLSGELAKSPFVQQITNIFMNDPGFLSFQERLFRVLRRFPEAFEAVAQEFEGFKAATLPALEHEEPYADP